MVTRTSNARRLAGSVLLGAALLLPAGVLAGCSDSQKDDIRSSASSLQSQASDAASAAAPRAAAEAMRASLVADRTAGTNAGNGTTPENPRSVNRLDEAADNVPGNPTISGIEDKDGDGNDDDGKVQFQVDDNYACLTVGTDGSTDVSSERC